MSNPYRAMCAELLKALESWSPGGGGPLDDADEIAEANLMHRARALLDQLESQPPPPSLKAQALEALDDIEREIKPYIQHFDLPYMQGDIKTVRAALEALTNDN